MVKFAITLVGDEYNKTSISDIICIKKSKYKGKIVEGDNDPKPIT